MQCPVCDDSQLAISSREGVEIDYCPQCRGVWLDRGELDKIIDRVGPSAPVVTAAPPPPQQQYREERYGQPYDKRKKRRSFLEDIFDFD